jgi:hypothetical protein
MKSESAQRVPNQGLGRNLMCSRMERKRSGGTKTNCFSSFYKEIYFILTIGKHAFIVLFHVTRTLLSG